MRAILELLRRCSRAVLQPERDICFEELAIKAHHHAYPNLIFRNLHKHTGLGFKLWAICKSDGYITDFEPAVIGNTEFSSRNAMLNLCRSLPHKNYRMLADNLFFSVASITACYELQKQVFLSGTASKNCIGFPSVLKLHLEKGNKYLDLQLGDYEAMYSTAAPMKVATVWCDSEKIKFLGADAGTQECQLQKRKRSKEKTSDHGKRAKLAPDIAVQYNSRMGGVDNCDHLRNYRTVRRRAAKPYMPLFFWVVDAMLTNAWCVYQRICLMLQRRDALG